MESKLKKLKLAEMPRANDENSLPDAELREDLLAAQELENVDGGAWCDYGCAIGCYNNGWISL